MALALTALVFFSLMGCAVAVWIARTTHSILNFRVLVIANYVAINLISGIVHILDLGSRRGFYDAVRALEPRQMGQLVLIQGVGLIGLCVGVFGSSGAADQASSDRRRLSSFEQVLLPTAALITLPIAVIAAFRIRDYAASLEVFGGRIISVDGGMARFVFMSHWLVWVVSFAVIWMAFGPLRQTPRSSLFWTIAALLVIAGSLGWTGGRSIAVVFALPLILVMLPLLRTNQLAKAVAFVAGSAVLFFYISRLSTARTANSRHQAGNIADWLDWEWGRFSMGGFGVDYVDKNGHLFGETFLTSTGRVLEFFFASPLTSRSSSQIAGNEIFNSSTANYLAPGFSFELYLGFGLTGILLGYFLVGWACKRIDQRFSASPSVVVQLFWAYLGTLVVFRVLPSEPSALIQGLLYSGMPLVVVSTLSFLNGRRRSRPSAASSVVFRRQAYR